MASRALFAAAVYLVLIRDRNVLLLRRYKTDWMDGMYSFVAGHLDGNETVVQAMIREAREESGLVLRPEDLELVHVMHRKSDDYERFDFFLRARNWSGEPQILEPDKADDLSWFPLNALPENMIPFIRDVLDRIHRHEFYSEEGW